jgi:hypothetical protein
VGRWCAGTRPEEDEENEDVEEDEDVEDAPVVESVEEDEDVVDEPSTGPPSGSGALLT